MPNNLWRAACLSGLLHAGVLIGAPLAWSGATVPFGAGGSDDRRLSVSLAHMEPSGRADDRPAVLLSAPVPSSRSEAEAPQPVRPILKPGSLDGYHSPKDVAEPAHVVSLISILPAADPRAIGAARLRVFVDAGGRADGVEIEFSSLPSDVLASALEQFRSAEYSPAEVRERAVKSWIWIELSLDTEGA